MNVYESFWLFKRNMMELHTCWMQHPKECHEFSHLCKLIVTLSLTSTEVFSDLWRQEIKLYIWGFYWLKWLLGIGKAYFLVFSTRRRQNKNIMCILLVKPDKDTWIRKEYSLREIMHTSIYCHTGEHVKQMNTKLETQNQ